MDDSVMIHYVLIANGNFFWKWYVQISENDMYKFQVNSLEKMTASGNFVWNNMYKFQVHEKEK